MKMDPIAARSLFPVTESQIYLQHAGQALISLRSREAVERVARNISSSTDWSEEYRGDREGLRSSLAELVKVDPDEVALTRGTAHALSLLARGIDWNDGDNVVSARGEFPVNVFPWTTLRQKGVELRLVDPTDGRIDPESLIKLVDERTRAVTISWIQFWNGFRADIAAIGRECKRAGVIFAIDGIQGVGAIRLDARDAGVDLLACGASKWLLGPPGIGFAYVRKELLDQLSPPLIGGGTMVITPNVPFEELEELHPNARRFEESAVSWFDIAAFAAGVDLINEVTMEVVEARVLHLSKYLGERLEKAGYQMVEPWPRSPEESSGIVSIRPGTPAEESWELLRQADIRPRLFRDLVRFSTHFFNTEEELDRVVEVCGEKIER